MDLLEKKVDKDDFYNLAIQYYINLNLEEFQHMETILVNKSIGLILDHLFIPTPCFEIKIEIQSKMNEVKLGSYVLYISDKKEFIDEFLFFN